MATQGVMAIQPNKPRNIPMAEFMAYVNFQRGGGLLINRFGIQGYEDERARLHNKIFLAAGFKDTRWGTARKTAAWFSTMVGSTMVDDPDIGFDQELVDFDQAIKDLVCEFLD